MPPPAGGRTQGGIRGRGCFLTSRSYPFLPVGKGRRLRLRVAVSVRGEPRAGPAASPAAGGALRAPAAAPGGTDRRRAPVAGPGGLGARLAPRFGGAEGAAPVRGGPAPPPRLLPWDRRLPPGGREGGAGPGELESRRPGARAGGPGTRPQNTLLRVRCVPAPSPAPANRGAAPGNPRSGAPGRPAQYPRGRPRRQTTESATAERSGSRGGRMRRGIPGGTRVKPGKGEGTARASLCVRGLACSSAQLLLTQGAGGGVPSALASPVFCKSNCF